MGPAFPISFHAGGAGGLEPIKLGMQDGMVARAANVVDDLKAVHGVKTMLAMTTCQEFMRNGITIASLLMSGILPRFPELRFISVESGVGWVPFVLESLDKHAAKYRIELEHPEFTEPPSFYFHRQVFANCWYEHLTDYHLEVTVRTTFCSRPTFPTRRV